MACLPSTQDEDSDLSSSHIDGGETAAYGYVSDPFSQPHHLQHHLPGYPRHHQDPKVCDYERSVGDSAYGGGHGNYWYGSGAHELPSYHNSSPAYGDPSRMPAAYHCAARNFADEVQRTEDFSRVSNGSVSPELSSHGDELPKRSEDSHSSSSSRAVLLNGSCEGSRANSDSIDVSDDDSEENAKDLSDVSGDSSVKSRALYPHDAKAHYSSHHQGMESYSPMNDVTDISYSSSVVDLSRSYVSTNTFNGAQKPGIALHKSAANMSSGLARNDSPLQCQLYAQNGLSIRDAQMLGGQQISTPRVLHDFEEQEGLMPEELNPGGHYDGDMRYLHHATGLPQQQHSQHQHHHLSVPGFVGGHFENKDSMGALAHMSPLQYDGSVDATYQALTSDPTYRQANAMDIQQTLDQGRAYMKTISKEGDFKSGLAQIGHRFNGMDVEKAQVDEGRPLIYPWMKKSQTGKSK